MSFYSVAQIISCEKSSLILKKTQMENVNIIYLLKLNIKQVNSL